MKKLLIILLSIICGAVVNSTSSNKNPTIDVNTSSNNSTTDNIKPTTKIIIGFAFSFFCS